MSDTMLDARHEGDVYRRIEVITGQRRRRRWTDEEKAGSSPRASRRRRAAFGPVALSTLDTPSSLQRTHPKLWIADQARDRRQIAAIPKRFQNA
jgi:hypothetical protein